MNTYAVVYQGHVQREFKCREDAWDYLVQRGWRWTDEAYIQELQVRCFDRAMENFRFPRLVLRRAQAV
jgi:hypothetical protein